MTQQRINQIKHFTVDRAFNDLKEVDFNDPNASFLVGKIFGKLETNLERELSKEKTRNFSSPYVKKPRGFQETVIIDQED